MPNKKRRIIRAAMGGRARAKALSARRRKAIAKLAGLANAARIRKLKRIKRLKSKAA